MIDALELAREVIAKYGEVADKPSVQLARALLAQHAEVERLAAEVHDLRDDLHKALIKISQPENLNAKNEADAWRLQTVFDTARIVESVRNTELIAALHEALDLYETACDRHPPAPPIDEWHRCVELRKLAGARS